VPIVISNLNEESVIVRRSIGWSSYGSTTLSSCGYSATIYNHGYRCL
jgi:hypothetical protein